MCGVITVTWQINELVNITQMIILKNFTLAFRFRLFLLHCKGNYAGAMWKNI